MSLDVCQAGHFRSSKAQPACASLSLILRSKMAALFALIRDRHGIVTGEAS
jgi:hypothetical protein